MHAAQWSRLQSLGWALPSPPPIGTENWGRGHECRQPVKSLRAAFADRMYNAAPAVMVVGEGTRATLCHNVVSENPGLTGYSTGMQRIKNKV